MDYRERWELKDYLIGRELERRVRIIHVLVFLLVSAFLLDFWYLQGVQGDQYRQMAENNRLRRIPLKPTRGIVYDRNLKVIASTRPSLGLRMRREDKHDKDPQLQRLAPLLGVEEEYLQERRTKMRRRPLYEPLMVQSDVNLETVARIEARREDFPSIEVEESARRHYPEGWMLSHALGYVGEVSEKQLIEGEGVLASGDIVGKAGIEKTYDDQVRGTRGWKVVSVNNLGRQIGDARIDAAPEHGRDLQLSLDLDLQRELAEGFGEEAGAAVFMNPKNGEILSIISRPGFDPNLFADGISQDAWNQIMGDPRRPLQDRSITSHYAPGSIFKVVMAAAGLEEGIVDEEKTVFCNGSANFYGRRRLCWKRGGHGWVALRKALAKSCNVYFYELGKELGIDRIHQYGAKFGLGQPTGVGLPAEDTGILPSRDWKRQRLNEIWYPGDTISVAIGQGFLTSTPIQMASMISVIANGGKWVRPTLLLNGGRPPKPLGFDPEHLELIRAGLADAVSGGTATAAALKGISVAGKTGTAQVSAQSATIDSDDLPKQYRSHAWFAGYAPAENPTIAFAVIVEHGGHGGSQAGPIARRVLEKYFEADPSTVARNSAP